MIYAIEQSAAILEAIASIELANNGYADIGTDDVVADAVGKAGYVVIRSRDLHGRPVWKGYTKAAQAALACEAFGQSTYRPIRKTYEGPDYEGALLAQAERMTELY